MEVDDPVISHLVQTHLRHAKRVTLCVLTIAAIPVVLCLGPFIYFCVQLATQSWTIGVIVTFIITGAVVLVFGLMCLFIPCTIVQARKLQRRAQVSPSIVWELNGDEWRRYVDHIFGRDHPGNTLNNRCSLVCWCCRRSRFNRFSARDRGYIVFLPFCVLVDEICILDFRMKIPGDARLITLDGQQKAIRVGMQWSDTDSGYNLGHVDLFVPRSLNVADNRLLQMVNFLNTSQAKKWKSFGDTNLERIKPLFSNARW